MKSRVLEIDIGKDETFRMDFRIQHTHTKGSLYDLHVHNII